MRFLFLPILAALLVLCQPATTPTTNCIDDAAGNLVFDGDYAYQYDAWQRQVASPSP